MADASRLGQKLSNSLVDVNQAIWAWSYLFIYNTYMLIRQSCYSGCCWSEQPIRRERHIFVRCFGMWSNLDQCKNLFIRLLITHVFCTNLLPLFIYPVIGWNYFTLACDWLIHLVLVIDRIICKENDWLKTSCLILFELYPYLYLHYLATTEMMKVATWFIFI